MAGYEYQRVEGILYGLAGDAAARPARPRLSVPSPGPRSSGMPGEAMTRIDVALAVRGLDESDRGVIEQHYFRGVRQPYRSRTGAVRRLVVLLGSLDTADE